MLVGGFHTTPGEYSPACWDKALQTFRQVKKLMTVRGRFGCSHRNKPLYRDKKIPWKIPRDFVLSIICGYPKNPTEPSNTNIP